MTRTHENETAHEWSDAFRTVLITLITGGVIWLVYTTVQTKSDTQLMNYKIEQIDKNLASISKDIKEISKKVK